MKRTFKNIDKPVLKYYVYFIYLPTRKHPVYVGKGTKNRYKDYFYYPQKVANRILRKKLIELKEQREDYFVDIVFESDSETEALDAEEFYISLYGRIFNKTGVLFNFECGGVNSTKEHPERRKPVYIRGFIFDSVTRARKVLKIKPETIKNHVSQGLAAYLDNPEQVEEVAKIEKKMKYRNFYSRHRKAFRKAKKNTLISWSRLGDKNWMKGKATAVSVKVEIDGVEYRSLAQAAKDFGFSRGHSLRRFLERGNHPHTYHFLN